MHRRSYLASVTALAGTTLTGCTTGGGDSTTTTTTTTTNPTTTASVGATVQLVDLAFDPVTASVETGSAVRWTNEDSFEHDVTARRFHDSAADWEFAATLPAGGTATHAFESPGVYEYACTIHGKGSMCGAVVVGDASLDESLPCQGGDGETTTDDGGGGDDGGNGPY